MTEVRIAERALGSIVQVGAWPDTLQQVTAALRELLATALPSPGHTARAADATLMGLAPGRWLLTAEEAGWGAKIAAAMPDRQVPVTDLSAARRVLRVEGADAVALLRRHIAFDLHPQAFPSGRCAQTQIHHMGVLLFRQAEDSFELHVGRSFGRSLSEWLGH